VCDDWNGLLSIESDYKDGDKVYPDNIPSIYTEVLNSVSSYHKTYKKEENKAPKPKTYNWLEMQRTKQ
jgi:hypothetical protein